MEGARAVAVDALLIAESPSVTDGSRPRVELGFVGLTQDVGAWEVVHLAGGGSVAGIPRVALAGVVYPGAIGCAGCGAVALVVACIYKGTVAVGIDVITALAVPG